MTRPTIFIGSSTEGRPVAHALRANLRDDGEVTVWDQGVFGPGATALESLAAELDKTDFAVLVFTADDFVTSRAISTATARDNVLFELGLFMGRLGRSSVFTVMSNEDKLKIPSDLHGVAFATYTPREDGDLRRAVGDAVEDIRDAMRKSIDHTRAEILNALSGRLIYLLRHLEYFNQYRHESFYGKALAQFECESDTSGTKPFTDATGWAKASVYACRLLGAVKLLDYSKTSGEVLITKLGREILADPAAKQRFGNAYETPMVPL
jgi:hypothetical protein